MSEAEAEAAAALDATFARLFPNGSYPESVVLFLQGRQAFESREIGGLLDQQFKAAAEWVLDALCHAHLDPQIKGAARRVLADQYFACNLDARGLCFSNLIRPGLRARLEELGRVLERDYAESRLGELLTSEAVLEAVGRPEDHPLAGQFPLHPSFTFSLSGIIVVSIFLLPVFALSRWLGVLALCPISPDATFRGSGRRGGTLWNV